MASMADIGNSFAAAGTFVLPASISRLRTVYCPIPIPIPTAAVQSLEPERALPHSDIGGCDGPTVPHYLFYL